LTIIRAHISDWHSSNPDLHPLRWFAAFVCAAVIYFAELATLGSFINAG
jgi:hypothetical protein